MSTTISQVSNTTEATAGLLCVDLDGTLVRSDTLQEAICTLASDPRIFSSLLLLLRGRAKFKESVALRAPTDPARLPYNESLLRYLRTQKAAGRHLVLATASDRHVACSIAEHLGIFDEVIASDGIRNLKGQEKASALVARFGAKSFCYAGNARSDLPIWRQAASAIVVNAPSGILEQVQRTTPVELVIADRPPVLRELIKAIRPHQWVKNLLALVPILTAHALAEVHAWIGGAIMFVAFCCTASAIYLINDMLDIAADRAHSRKRLRPFARGAVPLPIAALTTFVLLGGGLIAGQIGHVTWIVALYAVMSIGYSVRLKELPLVDVFMLAALYVVRLLGGGEATGHQLSLWLLAFSSFLFLSLALLKRFEEMMSLEETGRSKAARRGYSPGDAPVLQLFGVGSAFASSIVLSLFVQSETNVQLYASPYLLWLIVPLLLFWQCRMWLSGARGYMHHDPIIYAMRDRTSWAIGTAVVLVLLAAKSLNLPQ